MCLHTKFHKPSSIGLLVIAIKQKSKKTHRIHGAAMFDTQTKPTLFSF